MALNPSLRAAWMSDFAEHMPMSEREFSRLRESGRPGRSVLLDLVTLLAPSPSRFRLGVNWTSPERLDAPRVGPLLPPF